MPGPAIGSLAPDFTLPRAPVKRYTLSDYRGNKHVVVSFFALAFTGGPDWGIEATLRNLQRDVDDFRHRDSAILTIDAESMYVNDAYSRWLGGLSFPVLSDFLPRGQVSRLWDCWSPDREHPRNVTVVVDKQGIVRYCEHHQQGGMPDHGEILRLLDSINTSTA